MMKKSIELLVLALFALTSLTMCKDDTDKVEYIKFELEHSLRIPNHRVSIEIKKKDPGYLLHLISIPVRSTIWQRTTIDTTFSIESKTFKKISRKVIKLSKSDFSKSNVNGLDGYVCTLKLGINGQLKVYNIWTPKYDTKERGLIDYLNVCTLIIETAGLETKEIL